MHASEYESDQIPAPPQVPRKTYEAVVEQMAAQKQQQERDASAIREVTKHITLEYRKAVNGLLGDDNYERYQRRATDIIHKKDPWRERDVSELTQAELAERNDYYARKWGENRSFLQQLGTTPEQLHDLRRPFEARVHQLHVGQGNGSVSADELSVELREETATDPLRADPYAWTTATPPYEDPRLYSEEINQPSGSFNSPMWAYYWDRSTGLDNFTTTLSNYGNSDDETGYVNVRLGWGLWWQNPLPYRVFVHIVAIANETYHSLVLTDWFGFSSSLVYQGTRLSAVVYGGPVASNLLYEAKTELRIEHQADGSWTSRPIASGSTLESYLITGENFPQDRWLYVEFGPQMINSVWTNDVMASSIHRSFWSITQVQVRAFHRIRP